MFSWPPQACSVLPKDFLLSGFDADLKITIHDQDEAIAASRKVNALCLDNGIGRRQAYLVALTAEELAMNSLLHGFDDQKPHHLELCLIITEEKLLLRLRDDGQPFNLTERWKIVNPADPGKNIGLRIIFAGADEVSYNSSMNLNNVCIRIDRETDQPGKASAT